jgi:hypothetical protein
MQGFYLVFNFCDRFSFAGITRTPSVIKITMDIQISPDFNLNLLSNIFYDMDEYNGYFTQPIPIEISQNETTWKAINADCWE